MGLIVFVVTVFIIGTCVNCQDYSMCNNTNLIITRVTTEATCLTLFSGVLVSGISFDTYCSSLLGGLECAANVTMSAYSTEVKNACYQTMIDHVSQNSIAVFSTVNATLSLLNIPFTVNEDYVVNTSKCVADSASSSGGGIEGYVIAIIVICVVIVLVGAAVGAYFLFQKYKMSKETNRGLYGTDGTDIGQRPSTSVSPNQIQPLKLDADAMHYVEQN